MRLQMRGEIRRVCKEFGLTAIYVTHDQKEALSLADRVAVMHEGRIQQIGVPREVYRSPRNRFVAEFIGEMNFIAGSVEDTSSDQSKIVVRTPVGAFTGHTSIEVTAGQKVLCGFRPETVRIGANGPNAIVCTVQSSTYLGEIEQFHLKLADGTSIKAQMINPDRSFPAGESLKFIVETRDLIVLAE
jgi:iron(III) transport system ATP-binding protein